MHKVQLFFPKGIEDVWHISADGNRKYRLDGIEKLVRLRESISNMASFQIVETIATNQDADTLLSLIHTPAYLNALRTGIPKEIAESSGLMWQENLIYAFTNSALALINASHAALNQGVAGSISKGGHHAVAERGFGFNPINEIAIACTYLLNHNDVNNIAVLDLDAHWGNGVASLLKNNKQVNIYDIWNKRVTAWGELIAANNLYNYYSDGVDDYFAKLKYFLEQIVMQSPDLVIYHSGADVWEEDRLGGINGFTTEEFLKREELVIDTLKSAGVNIVLVLGGGYIDYSKSNEDIAKHFDQLISLHLSSFEALLV